MPLEIGALLARHDARRGRRVSRWASAAVGQPPSRQNWNYTFKIVVKICANKNPTDIITKLSDASH